MRQRIGFALAVAFLASLLVACFAIRPQLPFYP